MTKIRQYFYLFSGALAGILPILTFFKVIGSDQALNLTEAVTSIGGLIGAGGALTAGVIVGRQRREGTLDAAPVNPVDQVIANIPVVVQRANDAVADLDRLRAGVGDALGNLPVYGKEAQDIVNSLRF